MRQAAADRRNDRCEKYAKHGGGCDTAPHAGLVLCAVSVSEADPKTAGDPLNEAKHQIDDDACGAYGGQSVCAQRPAHNDGIGQRVKQLKEISAYHRQRKRQNGCKRRSLRQILCHIVRLFLVQNGRFCKAARL